MALPQIVEMMRPTAVAVTPAMLAAGRSAFLKGRATLDDLYEYFPSDLDDFLGDVFVAMAGAAS